MNATHGGPGTPAGGGHQADLYQQVILEHNKKPRNFGKLAAPTHQAEGFNPLCGDHLWVYLTLANDPATGGMDAPDAVIREVSFEGAGCAISKASASMMTAALKGKTRAEALALYADFHGLLTRASAASEGAGVQAGAAPVLPEGAELRLGKLKIFSGIWRFPSRVKCAALAWHTVSSALAATGAAAQPVSTE
jgi:nitrogen fixation NifU-like protein